MFWAVLWGSSFLLSFLFLFLFYCVAISCVFILLLRDGYFLSYFFLSELLMIEEER